MLIEFDEAKRAKTLTERGLDFLRAGEVFDGAHLTRADSRKAYAEPRFATAGRLDGRIVLLVWTPRGEACRVISLRKANDREVAKLQGTLGRS